jgi:hypothetical protein
LFENVANCYRYSSKRDIRANPSSSGTTRIHLKEWLRNQKHPNCFPRPFTLNVFTTTIFFSNVYQLHALIYGLKFILGFKKLEIKKKIVFLIKMALSKIDSFNFENP